MEAGGNPAQAYPYCNEDKETQGHCLYNANEKAFRRTIRSQDTCSRLKRTILGLGNWLFYLVTRAI